MDEALSLWIEGRTIPKSRDFAAFRVEVTNQLIKDFHWDASKVNASKLELLQLLEGEIEWAMDRDPNGLFAGFYRLDLGEEVIREILESHDRPRAVQMLAKRSLERAAFKVWTRWTF
ncbi:MAG: hypothetical protein ACO2XQ_01810 [Flavobacteriales bacterium]